MSPVVAVALLLVVAVVAVAGFQGWFGMYSSQIFTKVETDSKGDSLGEIKALVNDVLYFNNNIDNLSIDIIKAGNVSCNFTKENFSKGVVEIKLSDCLDIVDTVTPEIIIITNKSIITKKVFLKDKIDLVSISSSLTCLTDNDIDSFIASSCAQYPMTVKSFEGHLDVNDGNDALLEPDMDCVFSDYKDHCEGNFIVDGCGTGTVLDTGTGLCWQRNMGTSKMSWAAGINYCDTSTLAGHNDWRLPLKQELFTIVDMSRSLPVIVGGNGNKFTGVQLTNYWTATSHLASSNSAWHVSFAWGIDYADNKANVGTYCHITCVR